MKHVKAPASDSYQDYLTSRLQDPAYAALYLETHLEEEEDTEPELLRLALDNVLQALGASTMTVEQVALYRQKLGEIIDQPGSETIYRLATWLKELGLKLTVTVQDDVDHIPNHDISL